MPKQKDLKRLVRSRMEKTGEAYTTARRQILHRRRGADALPPAAAEAVALQTAPPVPSAAIDYASLAGMSDQTIAAKTGHGWEEWTRILDAIGAAALPHGEIARHVHEVHGVPGWWSQSVTVGYERIRGLREIGQRRGGSFEASKSRTLPVPLARLYQAWSTPRRRARWLPGVKLELRKAAPEKSLRFTSEDGSSVECWFTGKGDDKSQVAVAHRGLASSEDAARSKQLWQDRLDALAELLSPAGGGRG